MPSPIEEESAEERVALDAEVAEVARRLANPEGHDLRAFEDSYRLYLRLVNSVDDNNEQYKKALGVLSDGLRLYGPKHVYGSYNGGKDAVVIMHLLRAAVAKHSADRGTLHRPLLVYFGHPKEFPEVEAFVHESVEKYDLELVVFQGGFVEGLTELVASAEGGKPLGFVLGTRVGDPNCGDQGTFEPSSDWMPPFMRINPVLSWTYGDVWTFLRAHNLPYCALYDQGYTSLGKVDDTVPNPALAKDAKGGKGGGGDGYWPAYALEDWSLERAGRTSDRSKGAKKAT